MTDYLSHVYLYKDIGITRDYSVVHDMDKSIWKSRLHSGTSHRVWDGDVNYYRLGDRIRIEAPFELVRDATYGLLEIIDVKIGTGRYVEQYFFWVDDVRLLKNNSAPDPTTITRGDDVVELTVSEDIWSNYNDKFTLKDSYVERRHMPRWNGNVPIYYPDAAQGVDGAYVKESTQSLTRESSYIMTFEDEQYTIKYKPTFYIICVMNDEGNMQFIMTCDAIVTDSGGWDGFKAGHRLSVNATSAQPGTGSKYLWTAAEIMSDRFYSTLNISAENVQSIIATPYIGELTECFIDAGTRCPVLDVTNTKFSDNFTLKPNTANNTQYFVAKTGVFSGALFDIYTAGVNAVKPQKSASSTYLISNEPMMYYSPARIRKIVSGMGGTVTDVPDIDAFQESYSMQHIIDVSNGGNIVFGGTDIVEANAIGNLGMTEGATLPIFSSAWRSYQAISKAGDDMLYNAQVTNTLITTTAGIGAGAATAMLPGVGAAVGLLSGGSNVMSGASSLYMASKELEAKRTTIKNSPCNVMSTGSGLTAVGKNFVDISYMTLKLDPVSFAKLEEQYYFYGYFVNKTMRGTVDLHTRKLFDFIKTSGARVTGSCPADVLRSIGAIFDKGVTIYHGTDGYAKIGTGMTYSNDEYSSTSAGAENQ